jgi:hypothetical protein
VNGQDLNHRPYDPVNHDLHKFARTIFERIKPGDGQILEVGLVESSGEFVIRNTSAEDDPLNAILGPFYTAFDRLNSELEFFDGRLPPVAILLHRSPRLTYGHYWSKRLAHRDDGRELDEISINPRHLLRESPAIILAVLGHEMVHHWQQYFGRPPRANYHDKEFAAAMMRIGLEPIASNGKQTGQNVFQRIIPDGPFASACAKLLAKGFAINWGDRDIPDARKGKPSRVRKIKCSCPQCGLIGWGEPQAPLACGKCWVPLQSMQGR